MLYLIDSSYLRNNNLTILTDEMFAGLDFLKIMYLMQFIKFLFQHFNQILIESYKETIFMKYRNLLLTLFPGLWLHCLDHLYRNLVYVVFIYSIIAT